MSACFKRKRKLMVCGFVRGLSSSLFPKELIDIILSFYHEPDKWDEKYIGSKILLNKDENSITHTDDHGHDNAYFKNIVDSGIFYWKFKLLKVGGDGWNSVFGIWPLSDPTDTKQRKPPLHQWFGDKGHGYNFWAQYGKFKVKTMLDRNQDGIGVLNVNREI